MASYNEETKHIEGYDEEYKGTSSYENALTVGELYDTLEKYLKEGRLKREEKIVVSSKSMAGFAYEFDFSDAGFPLIKELCG